MEGKSRYENYVAGVKCSNCRKQGRIRVPIGEVITAMRCPNCGNFTLHHPSYFGKD